MEFSDGELLVMEELWKGDVLDENGEIQALALSKILMERHNISKTSCYTFLGRLVEKGAIARRYPKYTIRVLVLREDALLNKQKEAFHKLFKGSLLNMCKTFLQNEEVTKEEIEGMKKLIASFGEEDQEEDKNGNKSS